jgi:hypothetical protein
MYFDFRKMTFYFTCTLSPSDSLMYFYPYFDRETMFNTLGESNNGYFRGCEQGYLYQLLPRG